MNLGTSPSMPNNTPLSTLRLKKAVLHLLDDTEIVLDCTVNRAFYRITDSDGATIHEVFIYES